MVDTPEYTISSLLKPTEQFFILRQWLGKLGVLGCTCVLALLSIVFSVMIVTTIELLLFQHTRAMVLLEAAFIVILIISPIIFTLLNFTHKLNDMELNLRLDSSTDYLTQLFNRRYVLERAEIELLRVKRHGGLFSILLLDIDHFKKINDSFGHLVGDAGLRAVGDLLRCQIRPTDVVGRYGGEEFLIFLPDTDHNEASEVAERFRSSLEEMVVQYGQQTFQMTACIGVAFGTSQTENIDTVIEAADFALYKAKRNGRNQIAVATLTNRPLSNRGLLH